MRKKSDNDIQLRVVCVFLLLIVLGIVVKLFILQVFEYKYYSTLAMDTHEIYKQIIPRRGNIYIQDSRNNKEYPAAINRPYYLIYAVPRDIPASQVATTTDFLAKLFNYQDDDKKQLYKNLSKKDDPYEPVAKKVSEELVNKIKTAKLKGINYVSQEYRYYPEANITAHVTGFVGMDQDERPIGRYGLEGAWENELAGHSGFMLGKKSALGGIITSFDRTFKKAANGADLVLTIDRALQYKACTALKNGYITYKAKSAALIMLDAKTGAILAMCSAPDFNPNEYAKVSDVEAYNNTAIFTAYEPGSVFKPIVMAAALDLDLVNPNTTFVDPGMRLISGYKVYNALKATYGTVNMTKVLEQSINTGMIWVEEKMGIKRFKEYIESFGFGKKTGLKIDTEVAGDDSSFSQSAEIYGANASFGQGFSATPLQLADAYVVLANGGELLKPYIVKEARYADGHVEKTEPQTIGTVISSRAQKLITGMLISVVENGHGMLAKLNDYYVAGKTGTAQIASPTGGYSEASNHTFTGYFPANNPKFVLVVKYEAPQRQWAESTAAPTFKEVAEFTLKYYGIKGDK